MPKQSAPFKYVIEAQHFECQAAKALYREVWGRLLAILPCLLAMENTLV